MKRYNNEWLLEGTEKIMLPGTQKKSQTYWSNSISNLSSKPGPKYNCNAWPSTLFSSLEDESEALYSGTELIEVSFNARSISDNSSCSPSPSSRIGSSALFRLIEESDVVSCSLKNIAYC